MTAGAAHNWLVMQAAPSMSRVESSESSHLASPLPMGSYPATAPHLDVRPLDNLNVDSSTLGRSGGTGAGPDASWSYQALDNESARVSSLPLAFPSDIADEVSIRESEVHSECTTADSSSSLVNFAVSSSPSEERSSSSLPPSIAQDAAGLPQTMEHFYLDEGEAMPAFSQFPPDVSRRGSSSANSAPELGNSPQSDLEEDPRRSVSAAGSAGTTLSGPPANTVSGPNRRMRHKCSPEQVQALSNFFDNNRNPTGKMRQELAQSLGMPERSVQIWFQNKRAKLKHRGESKDNSPVTAKTPSSSSRRPSRRSSKASLSQAPYDKATLPESAKLSRSRSALDITESITQIPAFSLSIGTWRRVRPLTCFFSRKIETLAWTLKSDSVGFKLECPWSSINEMTFEGPITPSMSEVAEGTYEPLGLLSVRLERPPTFFMEVFRSASRPGESEPGGAMWRQCEDFTEARQGTQVLTHVISGPYQALREAVLRLRDSSANLAEHLQLRDHPEQNSGHLSYDNSPPYHEEGGRTQPLLRQLSDASLGNGSGGMPAAAGSVAVSADYSSLPSASYSSASLDHSLQAFDQSALSGAHLRERFSPGGRNAGWTAAHSEGDPNVHAGSHKAAHGGYEPAGIEEAFGYRNLDPSVEATIGHSADTGASSVPVTGWRFEDQSGNPYSTMYPQGAGESTQAHAAWHSAGTPNFAPGRHMSLQQGGLPDHGFDH